MIESTVALRLHPKKIKDMDEQLKTRSGDTLSYKRYQQLLKSATQHDDQSNRCNLPRASRKVFKYDLSLVSDLTETINSLEEICDADSSSPALMVSMMSKRGNNNKMNGNGNKNTSFDKDYVIPKEYCASLTPETKDFQTSMPNREKS